jgi:hypothetical protein
VRSGITNGGTSRIISGGQDPTPIKLLQEILDSWQVCRENWGTIEVAEMDDICIRASEWLKSSLGQEGSGEESDAC